MRKTLFILVILLTTVSFVSAQQISPFKENERVVFLGNSITDGGHYHSYIWLYYMTRFPNMPIKILNAGIGGDRASDIYKRLDDDVLNKKPNVLITTFGMNDSGYAEHNKPNSDVFAKRMVEESYSSYKLIEERFKTLPDVEIVLLGSSPYDETAQIENNTPLKNKHKTMLEIADFQRESARNNGWKFIDFNKPMTELNLKNQLKDTSFTLCGKDRIHPDNDGHMVMAYLFLKAQGLESKQVAHMGINALTDEVTSSTNCSITNLKNNDNSIIFNYLSNSLPYPLDTLPRGWGSERSQAMATDVVPFMEQMNMELLQIAGLKGRYKLRIDKEEIGTWTAQEFEKGINLAAISTTPQYQQALAIMHLNEERWDIERRFRDYAWLQFCFFQQRGLLFANNRESLDIMDKEIPNDGWLAVRRDIYSKMMHKEIREAWQAELDLLESKIYEINKPQVREIEILKIDNNEN